MEKTITDAHRTYLIRIALGDSEKGMISLIDDMAQSLLKISSDFKKRIDVHIKENIKNEEWDDFNRMVTTYITNIKIAKEASEKKGA